MRFVVTFILSCVTGLFCAYWVWQGGYGWLRVFLTYVGAGSFSLVACSAVIFVHSLGEE